MTTHKAIREARGLHFGHSLLLRFHFSSTGFVVMSLSADQHWHTQPFGA